jgi:hypothetical protein
MLKCLCAALKQEKENERRSKNAKPCSRAATVLLVLVWFSENTTNLLSIDAC